MNRRDNLVALLVLGTAPLTSFAQPAATPRRIGWLTPTSLEQDKSIIDAFRAKLKELGRIEGRDYEIAIREYGGRPDRLPALVQEILSLRPAVIVTAGSAPIAAFQKATRSIPIVFGTAADVVEQGFVASLAHPGGNITGVSVPTDVGYKVIELLHELNPSLSRIVVFVRNTYPTARRLTTKAAVLARFRIILDHVDVSEPADLPRAFAAARALHAGAMIVGPDALFLREGDRVIEFANSARLPSVYFYPEMVEAGGLMCYSIGRAEVWRTAARYVDQIAKGTKAADLPVQQPSKLELVINMKTARSIGVTLPASLLLRADKVIQ